jgi:hypothetical protein
MSYRQQSYPLHRRYARADAYAKLPAEDRFVVDALAKVVQETVPRCGPDTAYEIIAAIGELLAAGEAE